MLRVYEKKIVMIKKKTIKVQKVMPRDLVNVQGLFLNVVEVVHKIASKKVILSFRTFEGKNFGKTITHIEYSRGDKVEVKLSHYEDEN